MTIKPDLRFTDIAKKNTGKVTIDDIAQAAGVSTATVSRALNKPDTVSQKLRKKINEAVESIGYIPSGAARALASNRSFTVGAIVPTLKNAIFAATLAGLEKKLSSHNYTLLVTVSNYDGNQEAEQLKKLLERGVDGVVLVGLSHSKLTWKLLEASNCCAIATWGSKADARVPCVGFDNESAAAMIVDHLVELGHSTIAMIAGITKDNDRAEDRVRGVKNAMKKHGLVVDDTAFIEKRYSLEEGRKGLCYFLEHNHPPTAIICGNDVLAIGALSAAKSMSIKVPDELSITGFDNLPITEFVLPKLTTVSIHSEQIGHLVAESIIDFLNHGTPLSSTILEPTLLVRGTTSTAPQC